MKQGILFDKLLEAIILTPIKISDIADVDKFGLILNARILAYGPDYEVVVKDPQTGNELNRTINLSSIKPKPINLQPDKNGEFDYKVNDDITLTSKNYIWAYPGKQPIKNSISVMPELNNDVSGCFGVCSDYIENFIKI